MEFIRFCQRPATQTDRSYRDNAEPHFKFTQKVAELTGPARYLWLLAPKITRYAVP